MPVVISMMPVVIKTDPFEGTGVVTIESKVAARTDLVAGDRAFLWFSKKGSPGGLQKRGVIQSSKWLHDKTYEITFDFDDDLLSIPFQDSDLDSVRNGPSGANRDSYTLYNLYRKLRAYTLNRTVGLEDDEADFLERCFTTNAHPMKRTTSRRLLMGSLQPNIPPSHPLNLILHGPPGTGKTFETAKIAVEMCGVVAPADRDDLMAEYEKLCEAGRIEFVTFHQSFAYEDFVEGLRPEPIEGGTGFALEARDGVLKRIANLARATSHNFVEDAISLKGRSFFKMSLGRAFQDEDAYLYQDCLEKGYVGLGYGGDIDFSDKTFSQYSAIKARWRQDFPEAVNNDPNIQLIYALRASIKEGDIVIISEGNLRFRAIGEVIGPYHFEEGDGTLYKHRRKVRWLWNSEKSIPFDIIQGKKFSQVSLYNLGGAGVKLEALENLISPKRETQSGPLPHVLIIDEINRANVSKTFGELITLLEDDKRLGQANQLKVRLPYSGESFGLPANLHVLGTMNTADRSIALLDTALRRRFDFHEMVPDPSVLEAVIEGVAVSDILRGLNARIEWLYDRDHLIGHAWLMGAEDDASLSRRFQTKIIPLLQEYFHEDWDRVRAALGETANSARFVSKTLIKAPDGYAGAAERFRYDVMVGPYGAKAWAQVASIVAR